MITTKTITAATVLDKTGPIMNGRGRYQIECNNATEVGTAAVEVDFGGGYRAMHTIDLTDVDRAPYTLEAEIVKIKVIPSQEMVLAVGAERP